jgi:D-serine deaminase-like pyridoxal phosphate-dependent protein
VKALYTIVGPVTKRIQDLPTPALLLDADIFAANLARMAASGKRLRPHAKAHKCVRIAQEQIRAGAVGVCVATVAEAELMAGAGISGILLTSPVADPLKCVRIARTGASVVVDHPRQVEMYQEAAHACGTTLNVLVDIDAGDHRTGAAPCEPAFELAQQITRSSSLSFGGLQAYSVRASHTAGEEQRAEYSAAALAPAVETRQLLESRGIPVPVITGGSTGTWQCDAELTESQAGSYALMDLAYSRIGGVDFGHALTVLATVVSVNHSGRVTVDAGFKAFSTDRPFGPQLLNDPSAGYEWAGDEFGYVFGAFALGEKLRFIPPHCDPTVNLYDRIHVCSGDSVEDVWTVKS